VDAPDPRDRQPVGDIAQPGRAAVLKFAQDTVEQ
jgi:hypothetical protein